MPPLSMLFDRMQKRKAVTANMARFVGLFGRCCLNLSCNQASKEAANVYTVQSKNRSLAFAFDNTSGIWGPIRAGIGSLAYACTPFSLDWEWMFTNTLYICRARLGKRTFPNVSFPAAKIPFQFCETCTKSFLP